MKKRVKMLDSEDCQLGGSNFASVLDLLESEDCRWIEFDINRKPWIQLGHADNKEVWQAISQCPSGALSCLYRHGIDITIDLEGQKSLALDGDKVIGECDYDIDHGTWNIYHTEVSPDYKGKGIAKRLVYKVIEASERQKAKIEASCSYAKKVIEE